MDNTNDKNNNQESSQDVTGDDLHSLAQNYAQQKKVSTSAQEDQDISDLQREIQAQFSDSIATQESEIAPNVNTPNESAVVSPDETPSPDEDFPFPSVVSKKETASEDQQAQQTSLADIENPGGTSNVIHEEEIIPEQETIENLQEDIADDFSGQTESTTPSEEVIIASPSDLGVGETYYSDLNKAMSSNEPRTMSELIKQSAYEKKQKAVLSPTSKKNLMYILGTVFFLIISVIAWLLVFDGSDDTPEFITKERVNSVVFSDEDLGINTTGLQTFQTKSAIRSILERNYDADSVSQIYYVNQDDMGNLRRMGVKDVFERTDNQVPDLLYNNIENEFMHGVYTTDKNYPFIVMKSLSYDRAFEGMREWEPTMIDDLATYFDLPPEAVERSLLQDGFSDDLIKNKNVRVARYIPRESDRRGILDFLKSDGSEFEDTNTTQPVDDGDSINSFFEEETLSQRMFDILMFPIRTQRVYAQDIGGTFLDDSLNASRGATNTVCYRANKVCIDLLTGKQLSGNTTPSSTVACYDSIFDPNNLGTTGETFSPQEVQGQPGFICREVLSGGDAISDVSLLYKDPVCFDRFSGDRLPPLEDDATYEEQSSRLCFNPYQCKRVACKKDGREVSSSTEGQPGVTCGATNEIVSPDEDVRKSCVQFHELLTLESINNLNLCFDQAGRFVPLDSLDSRIQNLEDYYENYAANSQGSIEQLLETSGGLQCISPQSRFERLCLTTSGEVVPGVTTSITGIETPISENDPNIELCFEPFGPGNLGDELNRNINNDIRQKLAATAQQLRSLAVLASAFGAFPNEVSRGLNEAADLLWQISTANLLENEVILRGAEVTRLLEILLDQIDPGAPNSEVTLQLREIIAFIKEVLGFSNNVGWVTIGMTMPQGVNIYPNGQVTGGNLSLEETTSAITSVQQSMVLLGLMDPVSVTGTLDLVTQQALQSFLEINGFIDGNENLAVDQIFISAEMFRLIQQMIDGSSTLYAGETVANIDTYFSETIGLGQFSKEVQQLQIILFALGYDISGFNGIFDEEVCLAVQQYQIDNGLEVADLQDCIISIQTMNSFNETIRQNNYLGSGFSINSSGALEGNGAFLGTYGPGTISFEVNEAEANSLREGDIVLMYTFLDEETVLITRHESVITEVIRRRALSGIFN